MEQEGEICQSISQKDNKGAKRKRVGRQNGKKNTQNKKSRNASKHIFTIQLYYVHKEETMVA